MTPPVKPFRVIPCAEWGARAAKSPSQVVSQKPARIIFHHTAGHALELGDSGESYREAVAYVKSIQAFHMGSQRGWNDTGQNFTVTRNGYIFEGRHGSYANVSQGKMVVSAHCPGQNDQPGVEIEHNGNEAMTPIQREAAIWLFAWICKACVIPATHIYGHKDFFATGCPGVLYARLPQFRIDVATALKVPTPPKPKPIASHYEIYLTGETGHTGAPIIARKSLQIVADGKTHHLFDEKIVSFNGVRLESG
jgi:hypothetical protein